MSFCFGAATVSSLPPLLPFPGTEMLFMLLGAPRAWLDGLAHLFPATTHNGIAR